MATVLHIDDYADDRFFFIHAWLRAQPGGVLKTLSDALSGIAYIEGEGVYSDRLLHPYPDLVVLDLKMPGMNGAEFLRWRNQSAHKDLPVIILTGSADPIEREEALKLGAAMVLPKPPSFHDLSALVDALRQIDLGK